MNGQPASLRLVWIVPVVLALVAGCTGIRPLPAPPAAEYETAVVPGYPDARVWGDGSAPNMPERLTEFISQIRARAAEDGSFPNGGRLDSLVLSGGGSDGPFGAGLLVGWTEAGTRPEFTFVTGISAGALIAPFAFLGPDFDDELEQFSIENSTDTLITVTLLRGLLDGVGLVDNSKLRQKLRGLITPEVVFRIAEEHDKGRRLMIGTTNLDAQRPVYWGISKIAAEGRNRPDETADLITKIMLASASIPGAFPPQFFTVETPSGKFSEMHVDGGVTNQLFFLPAETPIARLPEDIDRFVRSGTIYIVRNTKITPDFEPLEPGLVQISARSISTMIKFGGRSDIKVLEEQARAVGFGVRVTAVPESFEAAETELFDPVYMRSLFQVGREMASRPETWTVDIEPTVELTATGSGVAAVE